jgi:chromosome segregation ATPase
MSSTQGVQSVELPEAVKNALELAQRRVSLLAGEEDHLRKLKISLETEVASIDGLKKTKQDEVDALKKEISELEAKKSVAEEAAKLAEEEEGKKTTELAATVKKCEEADAKLEGLNAKCQIAQDGFAKSQEDSKGLDEVIAEKVKKLEAFNQSVSNLL